THGAGTPTVPRRCSAAERTEWPGTPARRRTGSTPPASAGPWLKWPTASTGTGQPRPGRWPCDWSPAADGTTGRRRAADGTTGLRRAADGTTGRRRQLTVCLVTAHSRPGAPSTTGSAWPRAAPGGHARGGAGADPDVGPDRVRGQREPG